VRLTQPPSGGTPWEPGRLEIRVSHLATSNVSRVSLKTESFEKSSDSSGFEEFGLSVRCFSPISPKIGEVQPKPDSSHNSISSRNQPTHAAKEKSKETKLILNT
jgi:hypothetical protein